MSCVHLSFLSIRLPPQGELVDADKARDDSPKARSSRSSVQWVRWVIDGCSVAGLGLEWARPVGMEEARHHIKDEAHYKEHGREAKRLAVDHEPLPASPPLEPGDAGLGWGAGAVAGGELVGEVCGILVDEAEQG